MNKNFLTFSALLLLHSLSAQAAPKLENEEEIIQQAFEEVNRARLDGTSCGGMAKAPTEDLRWSDELNAAAKIQSDHLANRAPENRSSMHAGPAGLETYEARAKSVSFQGVTTGENTLNDFQFRSPTAAWLKSPGHCATIMAEEHEEIGIAYTKSAAGRFFWVMVVGENTSEKSSLSNAAKSSEIAPSDAWTLKYIELLNKARSSGIQCGNSPKKYNLQHVEADQELSALATKIESRLVSMNFSDKAYNVPLSSGTVAEFFERQGWGYDDDVTSPEDALTEHLEDQETCKELAGVAPKMAVKIVSKGKPKEARSTVEYSNNGTFSSTTFNLDWDSDETTESLILLIKQQGTSKRR